MIIINICMKHAIMHFSYKLNLKVRFFSNSIHMAILSVICTKDCFSLPQSLWCSWTHRTPYLRGNRRAVMPCQICTTPMLSSPSNISKCRQLLPVRKNPTQPTLTQTEWNTLNYSVPELFLHTTQVPWNVQFSLMQWRHFHSNRKLGRDVSSGSFHFLKQPVAFSFTKSL